MLFEQGRVFFPADHSGDRIVQQMVGFGVEKHDDLMDAVTMGLNYVHTKVVRTVSMMWVDNRTGAWQVFYNMEYRD